MDGKDGFRLPPPLISLLEEILVLSYKEERSSGPSPAPGASYILTSLIFLTCDFLTSSKFVQLLSLLPVRNAA